MKFLPDNQRKTIVSGVQPSGVPHLGNYLGALSNWRRITDNPQYQSYRFLFMIADLHCLTSSPFDPSIKSKTLTLVASYVASGIDPQRDGIEIFCQSSIPFHAQLMWLLSCITPLGLLERMTQFKDKSAKGLNSSLGLLSYPVLMACDVLLYNASLVPVGNDQVQHVELIRDIANKFNHLCEQEVFVAPEALLDQSNARIMSLTDGVKKMSKSLGGEASCIYLNDSDDAIAKKIRSAKTDSIREIYYDKQHRPEISNLLDIFCGITDTARDILLHRYSDCGSAALKSDLIAALIEHLTPIRIKITEICKDERYILDIINAGNASVLDTAKATYERVIRAMGLCAY